MVETWKLPPGWSGVGDWFSLLQDLQSEPQLEKDGRYVLFLQYDPWRLVCPQQSVVEVNGEQAPARGNDPLWPGGATAELKTEVGRLAATR